MITYGKKNQNFAHFSEKTKKDFSNNKFVTEILEIARLQTATRVV